MAISSGFKTKVELDLPTDDQIVLDLEELVRLAAKSFVHASSSRIPKFSGQARGTLLNLADSIGAGLKSGPPSISAQQGRKIPAGQSSASGRALSFYQIRTVGTEVEFLWETSVPYFERWGWDASKEGGKAFFQRLDELIDDNPPGFNNG